MQIKTLHRDIDYKQKGVFCFYFAMYRVWEGKISEYHDDLNWFTLRRKKTNLVLAKLDPDACSPRFHHVYMCKDVTLAMRRRGDTSWTAVVRADVWEQKEMQWPIIQAWDTEKHFSTCVPHHNLPHFHVNIRKVNTERNPHTCWLSHTHVKCIIKSVSIMNVYSVPDAKMIILYQSGQTRVIFAFLTFKSLRSSPLPSDSGLTSYFLHFWWLSSWLLF